MDLDQALGFAILGHEGDAGADAVARRAQQQFPPFEFDRPGARRKGPIKRSAEFGAARAHQSGKSQHLALMRLERDVLDPWRRQVIDTQADGSVGSSRVWVLIGDLATHHVVDQLRLGDLCRGLRRCRPAVAQNRHGIADFKDLAEPVRDVDDALALVAQSTNGVVQYVGLDVCQRIRRFVHDNEPRVQR